MTSTITDRDVRAQVEQYLSVGSYGDDFDVNGIVDEVLREYGRVDIDTIEGHLWSGIVQRHDTSAQTIRPDMAGHIVKMTAFFKARPHIPAPDRYSVHVPIASKAELDALAGDYGKPPTVAYSLPGDKQGAQFSVYLTESASFGIALLFYWVEGR